MPPADKASAEPPVARQDFARRLRELRVLAGYRTARSLARAIGIDENRYTRYERAEVEPDLTLIRLLAATLMTTPSDLLGPVPPAAATGLAEQAAGCGMADQSPVAGRGARSEALRWLLSEAIVEARWAAEPPTLRSATESRLRRLQATSEIYERLRQDAFGTIATLASETALAGAPRGLIERIETAVRELAQELGGAGT